MLYLAPLTPKKVISSQKHVIHKAKNKTRLSFRYIDKQIENILSAEFNEEVQHMS